MTGTYIRGEQDKMLQIEARLPGFGGFFLDSVGTVVVLAKPSLMQSPALIRQTVQTTYANRPEAAIREVMAKAINARIVEAVYGLSELVAIENRVSANRGSVPGLIGVGTSIVKNRVIVGFVDSSKFADGLTALGELGVPITAVIPEVWGGARNTANWTDRVYPERAGPQTSVVNRSRSPGGYARGSSGYMVTTSSGTAYMLLTAHQVITGSGINGVTGDTVLQPWQGIPAAKIAYDPLWETNCDQNPVTHAPYDYCDNADVAAAKLLPGVAYEKKLATSDYEGLNGAPAPCCHIHGYYPIQSVVPPEFVWQNSTIGLHKSGYSTGTTTGTIDAPVASVGVFGCIGPFPNPPISGQQCGGGRPIWTLHRKVSHVAHIGIGIGDSGGPVFAGNGTPYYALGIVVAGIFRDLTEEICSLGSGCQMWFVRWSDMEAALGLGPLNPVN
jgi:hypothetical protein